MAVKNYSYVDDYKLNSLSFISDMNLSKGVLIIIMSTVVSGLQQKTFWGEKGENVDICCDYACI